MALQVAARLWGANANGERFPPTASRIEPLEPFRIPPPLCRDAETDSPSPGVRASVKSFRPNDFIAWMLEIWRRRFMGAINRNSKLTGGTTVPLGPSHPSPCRRESAAGTFQLLPAGWRIVWPRKNKAGIRAAVRGSAPQKPFSGPGRRPAWFEIPPAL